MVVDGLRHQWEQCSATGRLENFLRCGRGERGGYQGYRFNDSDVYKLIEATAYGSLIGLSHSVSRFLGEAVSAIRSAQMDDGYINSHVQLTYPENRWRSHNSMHEMYCIGHLIEAGVAMHVCSGDKGLLEVAQKAADHVCLEFGPEAQLAYPGHPEIELALAALSRHVGDRRYAKTARWMIESRGRRPSVFETELLDEEVARLSPGSKPLFFHDGVYDGAYAQDDKPLRDQTRAVGHAVRAMYLYCGAVDTLSDDVRIARALASIWNNLVERQIYVTGGVGPSGNNEGFTDDYDLPNKDAYAETCAGIGLVMWAWRMFLWTGETKYVEQMERTLYNAVLSGVSLSCDRHSYDNPLESDGGHERKPWFECACCPPNIARLVLSIGKYCVAEGDTRIFIAMPVAGTYQTSSATIEVIADYPWSGDYEIKVLEARGLGSIGLRVPEWSWGTEVSVNGSLVGADPVGGACFLERDWASGDRVSVSCKMPCQWLVAHEKALSCAGRVALRRGPLVYCLEEADLGCAPHHWSADTEGGVGVSSSSLDPRVCTTLEVAGYLDQRAASRLYSVSSGSDPVPKTARFVPYFSWANRGSGGMQVWVRQGR